MLESIDTLIPLQILTTVRDDWVEAAAWSPDGRYVAAAGTPIVIWDVESGSEISAFGTTVPIQVRREAYLDLLIYTLQCL